MVMNIPPHSDPILKPQLGQAEANPRNLYYQMDDVVRPSTKIFRHYFATGYKAWQRLNQQAAARGFPTTLLDFERVCRQHPYLHKRLDLTPDYNFLATGTSTWSTSDDEGHCDLPPFRRRYSVPVTARCCIAVSLEASAEQFPTWFVGQGNHIGILTLVWAYVLAARWAEIVPGETVLEYTGSCAAWKGSTAGGGGDFVVDIGSASDDAARWWAAILAPNQGWSAGMRHQRHIRHAPWSTNLVRPDRPIMLSRTSVDMPSQLHVPAPSFSVATSIIAAYSSYHDIEDQSRVAFAAALMLPSASRIKRIVDLPAPQPSLSTRKNRPSATLGLPFAPWGADVHQLDRLLTLSCNNFIQSLLSSVIFEPGIPCNICGAWVQGAFAVLDSAHSKTDLQLLTGTLMARNPKIGFLWMGATVLGIHAFVLQGMRALFYPIDLTLAGWTGTLMSFVQEPVGDVVSAKETISRADESRLLFVSQSTEHTHSPLVSFEPFGTAAIVDCSLDVREHARCESRHGLYYSRWTWDSQHRPLETTSLAPNRSAPPNLTAIGLEDGDQGIIEDRQPTVNYSGMDRERDCPERATRNIFRWLRGEDGFPVAERDIREHEWIDNFEESDDECASPEGDGRSTAGRGNVNVGRWVARTVAYRRDSFY